MFDRFTAHLLTFAAVVFSPAAPRRRRSDRGDVPGWVLITVMCFQTLSLYLLQ